MSEKASKQETSSLQKQSGYSYYLLGVLFVVYIFNFIDRQIISILAEEIKVSLNIDDAQIGFLYGTVFAVFYAIFGIPLGKFADSWKRPYIISLGLGAWSLMTALSGTAKSFTQLAVYRIGVGIGEASATPAALSMLTDSFPARIRGLIMSLYSSGIYVGSGLGIIIGGTVLDSWKSAYPGGEGAPFALEGWQAAFLVVGIPGILMAIVVALLKEPQRGAMDGIISENSKTPFRDTFRELLSITPFVSAFQMLKAEGGKKAVTTNVIAGGVLVLIAAILIYLTGSYSQWIALSFGLYAVFGWLQVTKTKDPVVYSLIFETRALVLGVVGFAIISFVTYGVGFWLPPFFRRFHEMSASDAGTTLGWYAAIGGLIGIIFGGWLADFLKKRYASGRIMVGIITCCTALPVVFFIMLTEDKDTALFLTLIFNILASMWTAASFSYVSDMTLPRMRAMASAINIMTITFIGLALGPYTMGRLSVGIGDGPDALVSAILIGSLVLIPSALILLWAARCVNTDQKAMIEKAKKFGELAE